METERTISKCAACANRNSCGNSLAPREPLKKESGTASFEGLAKMSIHEIDVICEGKLMRKAPEAEYQKLARTSIAEIDRLTEA